MADEIDLREELYNLAQDTINITLTEDGYTVNSYAFIDQILDRYKLEEL